MEKRSFRRIISGLLMEKGFLKEKTGVFSKHSENDGIKVFVCIPDMISGFVLEIHLPSIENHYDSEGELGRVCRYYGYYEMLWLANRYEYDSQQIIQAVDAVAEFVDNCITSGKIFLVNHLPELAWGATRAWTNQNILLEWAGQPTIGAYSERYFRESYEEIRQGGFISINYQEFIDHEEFYRQYERRFGCTVTIDGYAGVVTITPPHTYSCI